MPSRLTQDRDHNWYIDGKPVPLKTLVRIFSEGSAAARAAEYEAKISLVYHIRNVGKLEQQTIDRLSKAKVKLQTAVLVFRVAPEFQFDVAKFVINRKLTCRQTKELLPKYPERNWRRK